MVESTTVPLFFRLTPESQVALIQFQHRKYKTKLEVLNWRAPPPVPLTVKPTLEEAEREMKLPPHSPERIV